MPTSPSLVSFQSLGTGWEEGGAGDKDPAAVLASGPGCLRAGRLGNHCRWLPDLSPTRGEGVANREKRGRPGPR